MTTRAIKIQLTTAFDASHMHELHDNITGHNNITIQEILEYLHANYGDLDENYLEDNE